jgi:dTDP-4-dehydrorhamnose reductase
MMRVAVLGGTGMAGSAAVTYFNEQGYDVYHMSRRSPDTEKSKTLDATDISAVSAWLDSVNPNVIFNCIGVLQKAAEDRPDLAILLNSYLPRFLEQRYSRTGTKIIHLSTDCVFSGRRGGYLETDITDGETIYDRTKTLGEINNGKDLTFRMSIIGPDCNADGIGLFNWFMGQRGNIRGFTKAMWTGVSTVELARAADAAIKQNLTGLYHLVPKTSIDKYSLLCLFRDAFNRTDITIEKYDGFTADKSLLNRRVDFDFEVRDYPQQVSDMYNWVVKHKAMYGHYF